MNIIQITPGAGKMFCGGCFRDNALVSALRQQGHSVTMVPLYLPLTLDEEDQSSGTPIFFSGLNVYLEQKSKWFRYAPDWLRKVLSSPALLNFSAQFSSRTRAEDVGDITISMLRGENGNQHRENEELIEWLKQHEKPDIISLSNILLAGMARKLKQELKVPIVASLQGEDFFLDGLPTQYRDEAWQVLRERAADLDLIIAPSHYFAQLMTKRLSLRPEKVTVVYNGIFLDGFGTKDESRQLPSLPVLGFFARMCREKGLDILIDAFIAIRQRSRIPNLRLKIGGSCGPADEKFVDEQRKRLESAGLSDAVEFHPNLTRAQKIEFLQSLSIFSVPALYGEAFGLYLVESWAAGTPVVQPRHGAFPELIDMSSAGVICEPTFEDLAIQIESLLASPNQLQQFRTAGLQKVRQQFTAEKMATDVVSAFQQVLARR